MAEPDLAALLRDTESDRTERKAMLSDDKDRVMQAICAFANDLPDYRKPGFLFIGVNDDGSCAGLPITDQLLRTLAEIRSTGAIVPIPDMNVHKASIDGCVLAVVTVHPSHYPPVRYKGRVWVRVGPTRAIASVDEERRLNEKRRSYDLPYDLRAQHGASVSDLDLDLFLDSYMPSAVDAETVHQNERTTEQKLAGVRFVTAEQAPVPTTLGVLVLGKSPSDYVPGAYVQFLRIDGRDLAAPIADEKEVHGPLPSLLTKLDEILEANVKVAVDIETGTHEVQRPDYPIVALQQYVRNAIMHRNYETSNAPTRITWFTDRIEIQSPGGPYGQVTRANYGEPGVTDYRNPNLAAAMRDLGYVQRFGVGLQIAQARLAGNGNPPPEAVVEDSHVLTIVRSARAT